MNPIILKSRSLAAKIAVALFLSWLISLEAPLFSSNSSRFSPFNHDLCEELKSMRERDQEARFHAVNSACPDEDVRNQTVLEVDQQHLPRLKEIIHQFGWPGFQLVGEEGVETIWLLIQHCDLDLDFQKTCLALLEEAVENKEAPKHHLAYLTDRVLVNKGNAQLYGTQMQVINGQAIPYPIQEPHDLDIRRKEMGLCPFDEYLSLLQDVYHLEK